MVTTKTNGFTIPENAELKAAKDRLVRVQLAQTKSHQRIREINYGYKDAADGGHYNRQLAKAATSLLDSGEVNAASQSIAELNTAMGVARREAEVVAEAVRIAERQVEEAHSTAAKELAETMRPRYSAALKRMKAALLELQAAVMEEHQLAMAIEDAGFSNAFSHLVRMPFAGAGYVDPSDVDPAAHIRTWLQQLREYHPNV